MALNGNYTIFGQLVSGQNILQDMTKVTGTSGSLGITPTNKITITASSLSNTNPNGVIHINAASATGGSQTNVTVTATDTVDNTQDLADLPGLRPPRPEASVRARPPRPCSTPSPLQ